MPHRSSFHLSSLHPQNAAKARMAYLTFGHPAYRQPEKSAWSKGLSTDAQRLIPPQNLSNPDQHFPNQSKLFRCLGNRHCCCLSDFDPTRRLQGSLAPLETSSKWSTSLAPGGVGQPKLHRLRSPLQHQDYLTNCLNARRGRSRHFRHCAFRYRKLCLPK